MRTWFFLLVALNLAFYVWTRQISPAEGGRDVAPLGRQVEPDKLRVVPPASPAVAPSPRPHPEAAACVEWGSFAATQVARIESLLDPLVPAARRTERRSEETAHWWVFLPPQGNRQAALHKVEELKALGVEEFFVMQEEGRWRWSISLGVFRSEDAAKARVAELHAKKVRSMRIGERETQVARVSLQVRDADADLRAKLDALAQEFPGTDVHDCPAAE
jgi:hypothetical protein